MAQIPVPLEPGLNAIAIQVSLGGNTLDELFETGGAVQLDAIVLKHDPRTGQWTQARMTPPLGWQPNFSVQSGEGLFVFAPTVFPLALRGSPATVTNRFELLPGDIALRAAPSPKPTSWASAIAAPPVPGDRVFRWNGIRYDAFAFTISGWIPREPSAEPGEALWFSRGPVPTGPLPVIVEQPRDLIVAPGEDANFEVVANSLPRTSYQWFRDGAPVESPLESRLNLTAVQRSDDGARFAVVASNRFGSVTSAVATLRVQGRVAGRLVRANGSPLRDQPVKLQVLDGTILRQGASAMTGAKGQFQIPFSCTLDPGSSFLLTSEACPGASWRVPADACVVDLGDLQCADALAPAAAPGGLGLWLPFNETNGPVAHNLAGGNAGTHFDGPNVATPANGPAVLDEFVRTGLRFDGKNDQVEVPTYREIEVGENDFSLGAWVRADFAPNQTRTIIDKLDPAGSQEFGYRLALSEGRLLLTLADGVAHDFLSAGQPVLPDGRWHLVMVSVQRRQPGGLIFYVDGVPSPPVDVREVTGSIASKARFIVGGPTREGLGGRRSAATLGAGLSSPPSDNWQGDIDEVCEFCRALTREEIEELVSAGRAGMVFVCLEPITVAVWDAAERIRFDVVLPNYSGKTTGANVTSYDLTDLAECTVRIPKLPSKSVIVPINGRLEPFLLNPPPELDAAGKESCMGLLSVPFEPVTPARRWRYQFVASPGECATPSPFVDAAPAGTVTTFTMGLTNSVPGPPRALALRVLALDPRGGPATNLSLNGAGFGEPHYTSLTLPGLGTGSVAVTARFLTHDPGVYYPIYLAAADESGTNYQTIATALFRNVILGTRPLEIVSQPADAFVEPGAGAALAVGIANANGPAPFQWRLNGAVLAGETASALTLASVGAIHTGFYDCVIVDADGAMVSDSAVVASKSVLTLGVSRPRTDLELSWPLLLFQFLPQGASALVPSAGWQGIEAASEFDGELFRLAIPTSLGGGGLFRLSK